MQPLDIARDIAGMCRAFLSLPRAKRWWLFAHFVVPMTVISYWLGQSTLLFPKGEVYEKVQTIALNSRLRASSDPSSLAARAFIFAQETGDYIIPLSNRDVSALVSLTEDQVRNNQSRLSIQQSALTLTTPLYGQADEPVSIVLLGESPSRLLMPGSAPIDLDSLAIRSRRPWLIALWTFIAMVFGLGLTISSGDTDPPVLT